MKIFLSYATASRPLAEDLCHRLQAAGHEVFFDREDLPPGQGFDDRIRDAIEACDLFVFLLTPDAVAAGRYTRTELKIAARCWPTPGPHVLPVLAEAVPMAEVPPYLRALTLLQPEGNLAAEVLLEVQARAALAGAVSAPAPAPAPAETDLPCYRTLTLRFTQDDGGRFQLALPGAADAASFVLPGLAGITGIEAGLWADARPPDGAARRAAPALVPAQAAARELGRALHAALFGSAAGPLLDQGLRGIDAQHGQGLRLVIDTTAAPALARLPWELLYDPAQDDFLCSDRLKPLVRRLEVDAPPPVLTVAPPLRLLIAIAAPSDHPGLQVGAELAHLDRALADLAAAGRLQSTRLEHTTLERLDEALLRWRPHLLHFIGHGDFDGSEGELVLESEDLPGGSARIAGSRLAVLLRNHLGSLRLVFLNSCLGAASARHDAFGGVAQSLLRRGVPAVVAMQFPVADGDAVTLARHFYRYLASGQPVDAALGSARAFMLAQAAGPAWAAPALYMNAEDGRLFSFGPAPLPPPVPSAPVVPPPAAQPTAPPRRRTAALGLGAAAVLLVLVLGWMAGTLDQDLPPPMVEPAPAPTAPPGAAVPPAAAPDRVAAALDRAEALLEAGQAEEAATLLMALPQGSGALPPALEARAQDLLQRALSALAPAAGAAGAPWTYTVRRGDTLWGIAARLLGDGARWPQLLRVHNDNAALGLGGATIQDPHRLRPGQVLLLRPAGAGEDREALEWRVARGDTLWRIADRLYGDGRLWPLLQQANGLPRPDHLLPGQRLRVPPAR